MRAQCLGAKLPTSAHLAVQPLPLYSRPPHPPHLQVSSIRGPGLISPPAIPYPDRIGNSTKYWKWKPLLTLNYSFVSVLIILVGVKFETFQKVILLELVGCSDQCPQPLNPPSRASAAAGQCYA